ncbi:DNA polymerase III subunit gamma/tau [Candidatus Vidania fulgoroideorum]
MNKNLYKKYRPLNFNDFFGQKKVIRVIKYLSKKNLFFNNIIIFGQKGTGKTTFSRIYSKLINCKYRKKLKFCNKCKSCLMNIEYDNDYLEIDSASNRGVEAINSLFKNSDFMPIGKKYKIISLDEAHMLSIYSFNFLLQKLEFGPEHLVVIFITTNLKKIPDSIKSRCLILYFKPFESIEIAKYIKKICKKEKINISYNSLFVISNSSYGSMRDALMMLEHSVAFSNNRIKSKHVYSILNKTSIKLSYKFVYYLINKNKNKVFYILNYIYKNKINPEKFLRKIFECLCKIVFFKTFFKKKIKNLLYSIEFKFLKIFYKKKYYINSLKIIKIIKKEIIIFKVINNKYDYLNYIISLSINT